MCPSQREVTCRQRPVAILYFQTVIPNTHLAAYMFPVIIYWFIRTCRMLTGHADCLRCCKWHLSFTEWSHHHILLWAAVVNKCPNSLCAADGHSADPGWLCPGAAPAQRQRCHPRALRGAGAAQQRQGRVHLHCQGAQVRVTAVLPAGSSPFLPE